LVWLRLRTPVKEVMNLRVSKNAVKEVMNLRVPKNAVKFWSGSTSSGLSSSAQLHRELFTSARYSILSFFQNVININ
jgi:hypothetical protein